MENIGVCVICGKEFVRGKNQDRMKYCSMECRKVVIAANSRRFRELNKERIKQERREKNKSKPKKKESNNKLILRIDELARKEGLSYGQYVAKYGV